MSRGTLNTTNNVQTYNKTFTHENDMSHRNVMLSETSVSGYTDVYLYHCMFPYQFQVGLNWIGFQLNGNELAKPTRASCLQVGILFQFLLIAFPRSLFLWDISTIDAEEDHGCVLWRWVLHVLRGTSRLTLRSLMETFDLCFYVSVIQMFTDYLHLVVFSAT